jgi:hypothetical protein
MCLIIVKLGKKVLDCCLDVFNNCKVGQEKSLSRKKNMSEKKMKKKMG